MNVVLMTPYCRHAVVTLFGIFADTNVSHNGDSQC